MGAFELVAVLGDDDAFGSIDDVVVLDAGRVAVLDRMNGRVSFYEPGGRLLSRYGRKGEGPGEFQDARALARTPAGEVLVVDHGSPRISVLGVVSDSLALERDFGLPFAAWDMCVLRDRRFLLGQEEGELIHEVGADGEVERSFGGRADRDVLWAAISRVGSLACSPAGDRIATVPMTLRDARLFSADGAVLLEDTIPGFSETVYDNRGLGRVIPRSPEVGYARWNAALRWLDSATVLVQLGRIGSPADTLEGRLLSTTGGVAGGPSRLDPRHGRGGRPGLHGRGRPVSPREGVPRAVRGLV